MCIIITYEENNIANGYFHINKLRDPSVQNWTGKAYQWQRREVQTWGPVALKAFSQVASHLASVERLVLADSVGHGQHRICFGLLPPTIP